MTAGVVLRGAGPVPPLRGRRARRLAAEEYRRFASLLAELDGDDWARPTDCDAWDVRQVVAHVVGATEANASLREQLHQLRAGRRGLAFDVDAVNALQVAERAALAPAALRQRFAAASAPALRRRARLAALRALPFPVGPPVFERWRSDFLFGVVYTRDTWMHRVDIARATGRALVLSADHDRRLVADVVADWAARHERPFQLTLTGPAGGSYRAGEGGEALTLDAVELCRILSGRAPGSGLLATPVPF